MKGAHLFSVTGLRPSWRLDLKGPRPAATFLRRNLTPSPCVSVKSFVKLSKSVDSAHSVPQFVFNVDKTGELFLNFLESGVWLFFPFRQRLRWERLWGRQLSLWLKPNLQLEISGESKRKVMSSWVWSSKSNLYSCVQHNCNPECQQSSSEGPCQEGQCGRFAWKNIYHFNVAVDEARFEMHIYFFPSGVTLPVFEHYQEGGDSKSHLDPSNLVLWLCGRCELSPCLPGYELTGLAKGGEQISRLKRNYARAVELLVELASLQVETDRTIKLWSNQSSLMAIIKKTKQNEWTKEYQICAWSSRLLQWLWKTGIQCSGHSIFSLCSVWRPLLSPWMKL